MTHLDSVLKSRDVTLPTKVCTVKGMFFFFFNQRPIFLTHIRLSLVIKAVVFPVVMYGCESWTVKKAERRRIDAFELWCLRRLLRVP